MGAISTTDKEKKIFPSRPAGSKVLSPPLSSERPEGSASYLSESSNICPICERRRRRRRRLFNVWKLHLSENFFNFWCQKIRIIAPSVVPTTPPRCPMSTKRCVGTTSNFLSFHMLILNFSPNTNSKLSFKLIKACKTTAVMFKLNHKLVKKDFQSWMVWRTKRRKCTQGD